MFYVCKVVNKKPVKVVQKYRYRDSANSFLRVLSDDCKYIVFNTSQLNKANPSLVTE